nr:recombinase family protein [uncultured Schaedlerella sp.]
MDYGYARCSTNESKQDINRQKRELKNMGIKEDNIFFEYESGTKDDRKELNRLMQIVKAGDSITSLEVSRLTRSTQKLCEIIKEVQEKQIKLVIAGSITIDCSPGRELDAISKGMMLMWGVFAELERDIITARIKSGMKNAKEKGVQLGRPQMTMETLPYNFLKYYPMFQNGNINLSELSRLSGISRPTIYKYLKLLEGESREKKFDRKR